jgi:hypothetical protein
MATRIAAWRSHPQVERHHSHRCLISCGLVRDTKRSTAVSRFISSTFVPEIALLGGEVNKFVSPHVLERLLEKARTGIKP